jgi:hypothetical protein
MGMRTLLDHKCYNTYITDHYKTGKLSVVVLVPLHLKFLSSFVMLQQMLLVQGCFYTVGKRVLKLSSSTFDLQAFKNARDLKEDVYKVRDQTLA